MSNTTVMAAAAAWRMSVEDLRAPNRKRRYVYPRAAAAYVLRNRDGLSYPQIGQLLGGIDHSSVIHYMKRFDEYEACNELFARFVDFHMRLPKWNRAGKVMPGHPDISGDMLDEVPPAARPVVEKLCKPEPAAPKREPLEVIQMSSARSFSVDKRGLDITERRNLSAMAVGSQRLAEAILIARRQAVTA